MSKNLNTYFDKDFYCQKYTDIKNSIYLNNSLEHFRNIGYKENREPCDLSFIDWNSYISDNKIMNNIYSAKIDFITNGIFNDNKIIKYNDLYESLKKLDINYYRNKNPDLQHLNSKQLINHFKNYGFYENREFYDNTDIKFNINEIINIDNQDKQDNKNENNKVTLYNINQLIVENYKYDSYKNLYKFNIESYKIYNNDLNNLSNQELINHFNDYGLKEKRLFCDPIKEFDCEFYLKNNLDIKLNNIDYSQINLYAWKHYLFHGYNEGKIYNKNHNNFIENLSNVSNVINENQAIKNYIYKTLIIYVYYNRPGEYKNETNLSFFINQTIKKRDSIKDNVEFLFIINNFYTEVNIPIQKNINILKNENCFDFEAYLYGIKYMEKKNFNKIYNLYENVMFMNCSCIGPFVDNNNLWLKPFYDKLNDYTVCCTSILTLINGHNFISGPQIPGYLFLVKSKYIYLLINQNNIIVNNKSFSSTVLGPKKNKNDCIISGEHCISLVLLRNNLNIAGICNQSLDYRQKQNYKFLYFNADRYPNFNFSVYKSVFIKNHWRIDNSSRDSLPVQWRETKKEIEVLNNMNFISYEHNLLNYNLLNINNDGLIKYNNYKWKNKKEFGNIFSDCEELIVFPISQCLKNINYYYYKSNNNERYIIESLKSLLYLNYSINFYTNNHKPFNFKIPNCIKIIYDNSITNNKNYDNKNLNSDLLFPCCDLYTFNKELQNNKFDKSVIKIKDYELNKSNYKNNKYINFLTMYF